MSDMDSKKGGCTSVFGIHKGDDMQKQQKTDAEMIKEENVRLEQGHIARAQGNRK